MTALPVIAIDQGPTATKAMVVAPGGASRAPHVRSAGVDYPRSGWAEQSATKIWETVASVIASAAGDVRSGAIGAVAISNQRDTVVVWDAETGEPIAPAIAAQCRRAAEACAALQREEYGPEIAARSGLRLDHRHPAAKIAWLLDAVPGARRRAARGELKAGAIDSWLLWKLTGGQVHATDYGNASRTGLFNINSLRWDPALAEIFRVPLCMLPDVKPSDARFGEVARGVTVLQAGIPVHAMLGDAHAALLAHGAATPGRVRLEIGTRTSLIAVTGGRECSWNGLSSTIISARNGAMAHALEGAVSISGHAAAFGARLLGLGSEEELTCLAESVSSSEGVCFLPALEAAGGAQTDGQGLISGLSLRTRPAHVARAVVEAIALQICDVIAAAESDLGERFSEIIVDGPAAGSDMLMRLLADLSGCVMARTAEPSASALGAARVALEALGSAPAGSPAIDRRFFPSPDDPALERARSNWTQALTHTAHAVR